MEQSRPKNPWPAEEKKILASWQKGKIFAKTLARESPKGNFVFYEGPPTANAAPGVHHVLARVFKDIIVRFRTMQGYHVERKAGWDTHGLPVELQVEKQLGLKSKPEIENLASGDPAKSIAQFNAACKKLVWQFKDEWEKLTERVGFWLDLKHPYITYENNYMESVWAVIAKAHERGLLYPGHKVVPYCPRCGTALSSHEVAQGYASVTEDSVYVKCRVTQGNRFVQSGDFILTWTTTPWTLPGNVALAVGPEFAYVRVKAGSECLVVARELATLVIQEPYKVVSEFKGKNLVDVSYQPLFPNAVERKDSKSAWTVVPAGFVTTTDGTGIVHTAVMYGEDDYQLGEQLDLPKQHTVGLDGKFLPHVAGLAGKHVKAKATETAIYDHLKRTGAFFRLTPYTHDYPFCWRCATPLLYYAKDSWFIAMTKVKDELLKNAEAINWIPTHIKEGRFGEWLSNVKDWAISRERYWGTPLPVWICQTGGIRNQESEIRKSDGTGCGKWQVVGSVAELKRLAGKVPKDLHRPFIDEIFWPCEKCGGAMRRVPEVLDVWLDSGSMPFAQYHYPFENQNLIDRKSVPPLRPPLAQGGSGGVQFPADYICEAIDQTRGWFYTLLAVSTIMGKGSSYQNVICLGHINDAKGQKMSKSKGNVVNPWAVIERYGADPLRWYLSTINQPGDAKNFDVLQIAEVTKKVFLILQNVVSFYQLFAGKTAPRPRGRPSVRHVLDRWILARWDETVATMTAALEQYQVIAAARPLAEFVTGLSTWYVRRSRDRLKAKDKAAVKTLQWVLGQTSLALAPLTPFFAEWLYQRAGGKQDSVHLEDWPQAGTADRSLLDLMAQARSIVAEALAQRMAAGIKIRQPLQAVTGPKLPTELAAVVRDEVNVLEYRVGSKVTLDTALTDALKLAGVTRELIRQINTLRKAAGLTPRDKIRIVYTGNLDDVLIRHREEIVKKTNAVEIAQGPGGQKFELHNRPLHVRIEQIPSR